DALEVPDVRDRRGQLDVAHALAADLGAGDFNAALVADLALVADALILAAVAFPVLGRSKNALAEQTVALRLQGTVVDGFGFFNLAVAPGTDLIRGGKADLDRIELFISHSANPLIHSGVAGGLVYSNRSSLPLSMLARSSMSGSTSSSLPPSKASSAS